MIKNKLSVNNVTSLYSDVAYLNFACNGALRKLKVTRLLVCSMKLFVIGGPISSGEIVGEPDVVYKVEK